MLVSRLCTSAPEVLENCMIRENTARRWGQIIVQSSCFLKSATYTSCFARLWKIKNLHLWLWKKIKSSHIFTYLVNDFRLALNIRSNWNVYTTQRNQIPRTFSLYWGMWLSGSVLSMYKVMGSSPSTHTYKLLSFFFKVSNNSQMGSC